MAGATRDGWRKLVAVAAMNHAGPADDPTAVSMAGGAFLEWMEGKPLPEVEALPGHYELEDA